MMLKIFSSTEKRYLNMLAFFMPLLLGLAMDMYVPSLPVITDFYHTTINLVQLTVSMYMLGYGISQFITGIISDAYGRKKCLLSMIALFIIASFAATVVDSIYYLNICRFAQGFAGGAFSVLARTIVVDVFTGKELKQTSNYLTLSWSIGPIIGPFIGSYLQSLFNWQANFYFFGIYALALFIFALVKIPETSNPNKRVKITASLPKIKQVISCLPFILVTIIHGFMYGGMIFWNGIAPFLLQTTLNYSAVQFGYIALVLGIIFFLGTVANRLLMNKYSVNVLILSGIAINLICSMLMLLLAFMFTLNLWIVLLPMMGIFFTSGIIIPNLMIKTMVLFPDIAGIASSVYGTFMGLTVFFVSCISSNLTITSQIPMATIYLILFSISLILFPRKMKKH